MNALRVTGRGIGGLLLLQLAWLIVPFVLLLPLAADPRNYLQSAAGASTQIKLAVALLFANGALTVGISIALVRVVRRLGEAWALWLLAAALAMGLLQAVDNVLVLSMLSLSETYLAGAPGEISQAVAAAVGSMRGWAHTTEILAIDCWMLVLYATLHRFSLVPRWLAAFGLITVLLHFTGIPMRRFLGLSPAALLGMPMALSHLLLALWIMAKGLVERAPDGRDPRDV